MAKGREKRGSRSTFGARDFAARGARAERGLVRRLAPLALAAIAALAASGCVSVDYVGKSYAPTANVDVYLAAADVKRPYETMGEVRAEVEAMPFTSPGQQLQDKLVQEARMRGADGIIIGSLDQRTVGGTAQTVGQSTTKKKSSKKKSTSYTETTTATSDEVSELRGTLIRYTRE